MRPLGGGRRAARFRTGWGTLVALGMTCAALGGFFAAARESASDSTMTTLLMLAGVLWGVTVWLAIKRIRDEAQADRESYGEQRRHERPKVPR